MKTNIKMVIYVVIIISFASVIWIKYDYDNTTSEANHKINEEEFLQFIHNHGITELNFNCPIEYNHIRYMDDNYLLLDSGELYQININRSYDNGDHCQKIDSNILFDGFYDHNLVYDSDYHFYSLDKNLELYNDDSVRYYIEDLQNLDEVHKSYPYIYFYDIEAKKLKLDETLASNKLLIDNKGNINIYTNYGYPNSFSLLNQDDTEIVFNRADYSGVILAIYRANNNQRLNSDEVVYLSDLDEVMNEIYGMRIITTSGMYNEVMDTKCNDHFCNTKLVMDQNFSNYFNSITYSNGKYLLIESRTNKIYNIEKYIPE